MELRTQWQLHLHQMMLLQCLNCRYSVLPICLPLLFALFSHFTASLPNLTVRLLIRRSVSQAVLSLCRNLHLLSVYLHLGGKKPPRAGSLCPPSLSCCLSTGTFQFPSCLVIVLCFFAHSNLNHIVLQLGLDISPQIEMSHVSWPGVN